MGIQWSAQWYSGFNVSYLDVNHRIPLARFFGGVGDSDFQNYDFQGFVSYEPVAGMLFGIGLEYKDVHVEDESNFEAVSTFFRAQRTF